MPQIKLHDVISFTSEDTKHTIENLITGNGMWLCPPDERASTIKAEFQLEKASTIDYIDIGNYNTAMLTIEVGMSTWPSSQSFPTLLSTVAFMTPRDCRIGQNMKTVRMFKKENFNKNCASKKWDRIRISCHQPFCRNSQFGLVFFRLYSESQTKSEGKASLDLVQIKKEKESLFMASTSQNKSPKPMSETLKSLETRHHSPAPCSPLAGSISRAGKMLMAHQHVANEAETKERKKKLECEALNFLISLNLTENDIRSLKVAHVRQEFEARRGNPLTFREKVIFKDMALDYAMKELNRLSQSGSKNAIDTLELPDDDPGETDPPTKKRKITSGRFTFKQFPVTSPTSSSLYSGDSAAKRRKDLTFPSPMKKMKKKQSSVDSSSSQESSMSDMNFLQHDSELCPPSKAHNSQLEDSTRRLIKCPLCTGKFPSSSIESHASSCDGISKESTSANQKCTSEPDLLIVEHCPICGKSIEVSKLEQHADQCAAEAYDS